ncbi:lysine--tRNA ligase [Stackebrandtia nassauensis]|uniref:Lysine--tRNA ligase n=1 Tax=Stackebrandtia nassauensis (strain DSM 44728 / CIP 108903 / NRRL B-16338 / NBRC 102104 / LLR-40K-21) TaxID=446470 RepID=D3Q442_STANL|nr:lysine--tRNA ligase [Stackebrandtia nassauensis]ADD45927.1 lysyl-tRNA synthetase [Stackebrandtia nassauensis DSM 44728]
MTENPSTTATEDDIPEQLKVRHAKRADMLAEGAKPYPLGVKRTTTLKRLREEYGHLEAEASTGVIASVTGRVIFVRTGGKLCFATIREGDGTQLQLMLSLAKVGEESLGEWKRLIDIGDVVAVTGEVITSKRGELSVMADEWEMAAKALRPLPVAHKPMSEETRVRQRYVDLIMRPEARDTARNRAAVVHTLRDIMHQRDFMEVETPVLQAIASGANARPFTTHFNAINMDVYLRIALELYLKRCVVGGIDRVFEISRNFRNEGADSTHSPEFSMMEAYEAYGDYRSIGRLTRDLVVGCAESVFGSTTVTHADGTELEFGGEWREVTLFGALSEALGEPVSIETPYDRLVAFAEKTDLEVNPVWGPGKLAEELFEHLVTDTLVNPTFVLDYPEETSPLTAAHRDTPGLTEKWDLYVRGVELATGYSELIDPVVQRERFEQQARLAAKGDDEAMKLDEDFLRAMEYGMPPTGGMGMGIDRLLMALTGLGIRETILFPFVKPE